MLADLAHLDDYMALSVDLQIRMHSIPAVGFPEQKDKLIHNITAAPCLEKKWRQKVIMQLQNLETGSCLCHGDYHVLNLIMTSQGLKIIDLADISSGSASADACRSYLLYLIYRKDIAEIYLDHYCRRAGTDRQEILQWLPVVAAARLYENVTEEDIKMLKNLIVCGVS